MSVKGKVKKLNKKIENLQEELQTYQLSNSRLRNKNDMLNIELEGQKAVIEELENSIPVSLVEEKILNPMKEEHDKAIKGFMKRDIPQCIEDGGIAQELGYFIGKIEELLEKRK